MGKEMGGGVKGIKYFWNYEKKEKKDNLLLYVDKSLLKF